MRDSWQFYTNNLVLFNILMILVLIITFFEKSDYEKSHSLTKKIILSCVLLLLAARGFTAFEFLGEQKKINNNNFSSAYLSEIQNSDLNERENLYGALIAPAKRFYPFESEVQANLAPYLSLMPQFLPCVYLGNFESFVADDKIKVAGNENNNAKFTLFYQFMETQKKENAFVNSEQSQSDFIDKFGIKYLIVEGDLKISKEISGRVDKVITDSISKQKLILLK
jgi:hypothetical protein